MNNRNTAEVAGQAAQNVHERYPGYRIDLVKALVAVLDTQRDGLPERARREQIAKVVEGLATRCAAEDAG
jgi:hypothetical protein